MWRARPWRRPAHSSRSPRVTGPGLGEGSGTAPRHSPLNVSLYGTVSRILLQRPRARKVWMRYPACVEPDPENTPPGRPGALIGAVDIVLRLLRLFESHEMIRVNQVARDMGLSRSTVHRMLATLSHHQFVEQDAYSRAYKPGPALVDIGLAVVSKIDIRAVSHTALVELRDLTGETAHLGVMRGATNVLFLDSVESDRMVRTGSRTGR